MWVKRLSSTLACLAAAVSGLLSSEAALVAQESEVHPLEARVWLDRDPNLRRGDRVRVYYRVDQSAYVAIFHIDSNGTARMVFPSSPQENHYARGGRDYRVLFPGSSFWFVDDDPGIGYFFIVASPQPFDFRQFGYTHYSGGWDLSQAGSQVYQDPYLAMDDYVAALIPDWEYVAYGLDFTEYHVDGHYDYPRFLCYDCHAYRPYYVWNPYRYTCSSFRVVIYSDPYFYPSSRYLGTRVVFVQPRRGLAHYAFKERAVGEPGTPHVVVRNTPPVSQPGVAGGETRRAVPRAVVPGSPGVGSNPIGTTSGANRRSVSPGNPQNLTTPPRGAGTGRPVLERRPPTGGTTGSPTRLTTPPRTPVTRPSGVLTRPRGGGTRTTPTVGRGSSGGSTIRPGPGSGGSSAPSRPTIRTTGSRGTTSRPTVRSGGSSAPSRPTIRTTGSRGTTSRPTVRSGGSGTSSRPTVRRPATPPRKPRGGGG